MSECQYCGAPADLALCSPHGRELRTMLDQEIPWCIDTLTDTAVGNTKLGETLAKGDTNPEESPVPYNNAASTLLTDIHDTLLSTRIELAKTGVTATNKMDSTRTAQWLAHHFVAVMSLATAGQLLARLDKYLRRTVRVSNKPTPLAFRGPCPTKTDGTDDEGKPNRCRVALYSRREATEVTCTRCQHTHNIKKLEDALLDSIDDYCYTATEILRIMAATDQPLSKATFYRWVGSHKIIPAGYHHGKPLYLISEVRQLATRKDK